MPDSNIHQDTMKSHMFSDLNLYLSGIDKSTVRKRTMA